MANDRRRTTRRAVLGKLDYELDTAVAIPEGHMARAQEIVMVAKAKAWAWISIPIGSPPVSVWMFPLSFSTHQKLRSP